MIINLFLKKTNLIILLSKKAFIEELFKESSEFRSQRQSNTMANLLDTVSSDIYSDGIRFVFELIQNADDAAIGNDCHVFFDFAGTALAISHNGQPFSEADINSLTSAGESSKETDQSKTGYKGIGFKSVFGKSRRVSIFSDGYQFRFDKDHHGKKLPWQIIPVWTEASELPVGVLNVIAEYYPVTTVIELPNADELQSDLDEVLANGRILLFLRRVTHITVRVAGVVQYEIEKRSAGKDDIFTRVILCRNGKQISEWLVKAFDQIPIPQETLGQLTADEKTPPKLQAATHTELALAVKVENDRIIPLKGEESLIFTYLPTKVTAFGLPFLINASFLTNAPRESIHEDIFWNAWLMKLAAEKLTEWLAQWNGTAFGFQLLKTIPSSLPGGVLGLAFSDSLKTQFAGRGFLPSAQMTLKKAPDLMIDVTSLSAQDFIDTAALVGFINRDQQTNYASDCFVHPALEEAEKLEHFQTRRYNLEHLERFFLSPEFTASHQPADNVQLIRYFMVESAKPSGKDLAQRLPDVPFIFSDTGVLKRPGAICFPGIAYTTDFGAGVSLIHQDVYQDLEDDQQIIAWLEGLGVMEPSEDAYLENELIGNIDNCITVDNYLQITRFLFNRYRKQQINDTQFQSLGGLMLMTTAEEFIPAKQCFLADAYSPALCLEQLNDTCKYVTTGYVQQVDLISEWKSFFLRLGVAEKVAQVRISLSRGQARSQFKSFLRFFDRNNTQPYTSYAGGKYNNEITTYKLSVYSLLEYATEFSFSKTFWDYVFQTRFARRTADEGLAAWQNKISLDENLFEWSLSNTAILPTKLKTCACAGDIFINDQEIIEIAGAHLPVLDYDRPLSNEWKALLPLKKSLSLDDYLNILSGMSEGAKRAALTRADEKRLGLIYNKLADMMVNMSEEDCEQIMDWGAVNRLPSTNRHFELVHQLKIVNIAGFDTSTDSLKVMLLPQNSRPGTDGFKTLMQLLRIQEIDSFVPYFGEQPPEAEISLKNKLLHTLPYFALLVAKKKYEELSEVFRKLLNNLKPAEFFRADIIRLTFENGSETISGPALNIYRDRSRLYFKGKWHSPLVMYGLLPELTGLLEVREMNEDLRLLLDLSEAEIEEFFTDLGYDVQDTAFLALRQQIQPELERALPTAEAEIEVVLAEGAAQFSGRNESTDQFIDNVASENDPVTDDMNEDHNFSNLSTPFEPQVSAADPSVMPEFIRRDYLGGSTNHVVAAVFGTITDATTREDVGRWSEERVYTTLSLQAEFQELVWVNAEKESGLPYDISYLVDGKRKYIDVKGTPSSDKDIVYLSGMEWKFMFEQGADYAIFRLFNAGTKDASILEIPNPAAHIISGSIMPNPIALRI